MNTQNSHWFFFIFFFKGKCYFSLCHSPQLFLSFSFAKHSPFNSSNSGKIQIKQNKYGRIHQAWAKHCFSSMGTTFLLTPAPPKTSQELTINTSLWTANRNRIHTMHIFINSCPFYKLFAYMNHSSLVTVHLIVGDLHYITVLWCSHHARGQISLHRRDQ